MPDPVINPIKITNLDKVVVPGQAIPYDRPADGKDLTGEFFTADR